MCLLLLPWGAAPGAQQLPRIAVIIDDLGHTLKAGRAVLALPGAVTLAMLPHTPFAARLADLAERHGKEVMLHLPMQAANAAALGPGGLTLDMTEIEFRGAVRAALRSVPRAVGVNNHMGSLLTRHPGAMQWLMEELQSRQLYFIDSRTTVATVAESLAAENGVSVTRRHVFLDADVSEYAVRQEFARLLRLARRQGQAVAIGHPHPTTLRVLSEKLPRLAELGVELVPASRLTQIVLRKEPWHESSSRLLKVAKKLSLSRSSMCCAEPK
jgi:polysaccharide deacetylase 2 family uncharacterized protein YibQ